MSDFACPVIRVGKVGRHPNADTLSITDVEGCPVIFKTGDFNEGDFAVYVPVDAVVKQDSVGGQKMPWLQYKANGTWRIRAARLRGIFSMGVLVSIPPELDQNVDADNYTTIPQPLPEGFDLASALEIVKYEEPEPGVGRGEDTQAPAGWNIPVYDLEPFRKYKGLFNPNEYVAVTEKIHGCNARFAFLDGKLHVGSHNRWKRRPDEQFQPGKSDIWWRYALAKQADGHTLEERICHPDVIDRYCFYGELYGQQAQDLKYGVAQGCQVAMFDILDLKTRKWLDYPDFLAVCGALNLDTAPCLFTGQLDEGKVFELAEGLTEVGDGGFHIREGVVVRPLLERNDLRHGRVCYKLHGQAYLLRKGGTERH